MTAIDPTTNSAELKFALSAAHAEALSQSPDMDEKARVQNSAKTAASRQEVEKGKQKARISQSLLEKQIERIKEELQSKYTSVTFSVDRKTNSLVVKVIESEDKKLIRQIPPDEMLALRARIEAMLGTFCDKTV